MMAILEEASVSGNSTRSAVPFCRYAIASGAASKVAQHAADLTK